jgi:hypothetical protein
LDHEEPTLTTDPELEDIAAELRAREPLFTRPELGTDRETFEQMMRRSTIWRKDEDQWQIEYHQGTMVEGA